MNDVAIEVKGLSKIYKLYDKPSLRVREIFSLQKKKKYYKEFKALDSISFSLRKGETLGVIGKNGAGKSTLLKLITGVTTQTSGSIYTQGEVCALLELGTGFNPEYTGYENIFLNGSMRGFSQEQMQDRLKFIVDFADIGAYIGQPVKTYSSGMFARLAFAVMVSFKPDILIVDEALSVGDVFFQQKCNAYMKEEMKDVTKILVTHDMNSIANMADRVLLLEQGHLIREGQPLEVIQDYLKIMHTEVFADEKGGSILESGPAGPDPHDSGQPAHMQSKQAVSADGWIPVREQDVGGAGEIRVEQCGVWINDTVCEVVKPGDQVKISLQIISEVCPGNVICGYTFKDKYGNSIFAQNTLGEGIHVIGLESGERYALHLTFQWPEVKEGDYFLTLGIGEGSDQMVHKIQCWAHAVVHLECIALKPMHGIINHTIDTFHWNRLKG